MVRRIWFLFHFVLYVQAEYKCVCSFDAARPVFKKADKTSDVIGFLTTNACRQFVHPVDETWNAIVFMHQLGFIMSNSRMIQTCLSDPVDSFTTDGTKETTSMTLSTTPSTSTSTPFSPSMARTPTSSTTSNPSTTTTTRAPLLGASSEGHTQLCPNNVKGDVNLFGGVLGQYWEYCLELVKVNTQWHNAQRHCTVAGHGNLVDIKDQLKQDYVLRLLANHTDVQSIWLGLTDDEKEGAPAEGNWTWVTGGPVSYTNFGQDYRGHTDATHRRNNCVIMKQGGEWTDVPCGVALVLGTGFGERHNFICQYNLTSKPLNIFHELSPALVG